MLFATLLVLASFHKSDGAPTEGPVRIELGIPGAVVNSAVAINDLVSENLVAVGDTVNKQIESIGNLASEASVAVTKTLTEGASAIVSQKTAFIDAATESVQNFQSNVGLFAERPRALESAILESENFDSKTKSVKEGFSQFVAGIFQPKPIVDTITEEEKYGNSGDKFAGIGRALVSGSESVTNLLSQAVQFPVDFLKSITRKTSSSLNNLGSKLIGL